MKVIELLSPHVHSVCYSLHVGAGSLTDPPNRPGVASLTQRVVIEAETMARRRSAPHGRMCYGGVDVGQAYVTVWGHRSRGEELARLVPQVLADAEFTEEALLREKSRLWDTLPDTNDGWTDTTDLVNRLLLAPGLNWNVFGSRESVESITVADVATSFNEHWLGSDMVLAVAGAYSREDLEQAVGELSTLVASAGSSNTAPFRGGVEAPRRAAVVPVPDERFSLHLLFPGVSVLHSDAFLIRLLDCIVGGTPDARVPKRLAWDLGLADASYSMVFFVNDQSILTVYVEGIYERFHEILRALVRSVESLTFEPPTKAELQEAQTVLAFERDYQLDDPQTAATARGSLYFASGMDDPLAFEQLLIGEPTATRDQVFEAAQRVLSWDNLSVLYVGPEVEEVVSLVQSTWPYKPIEIWGE
ncbi:MAG TPA: insulinase family protein [Armatimonadota bacterium]|nr:insulinase family protein [Armatimonadota bacterium]